MGAPGHELGDGIALIAAVLFTCGVLWLSSQLPQKPPRGIPSAEYPQSPLATTDNDGPVKRAFVIGLGGILTVGSLVAFAAALILVFGR